MVLLRMLIRELRNTIATTPFRETLLVNKIYLSTSGAKPVHD